MSPEEHAVTAKLRRVLAELDSQSAIELLLKKTRTTSSNAEFLLQMQRNSPLS
jgi:transcription termination factor Rho